MVSFPKPGSRFQSFKGSETKAQGDGGSLSPGKGWFVIPALRLPIKGLHFETLKL